jgi:uncharacterized protein (DUF362 family)
MTMISRRTFIRAAAAGLSGAALNAFLAACGARGATPAAPPPPTAEAVQVEPTPTRAEVSKVEAPAPTTAPAPAETPAPVSTEAPAAANLPAATNADMVVTRGGEPEKLVRWAIAALGGMEKFVPKGSWVIVKPNICSAYLNYEYAATTNPWVVATLVKLCLEAGAKRVQVLDLPFNGSMEEAYASSGIAEAVKASGGEITVLDGGRYTEVEIPNAASLKNTQVYQDVLDADVLINVPIAKHHSMSRLTLGMKNLMGLIQDRGAIHSDFKNRLPDLAGLFRPQLTVVDAVRILMDHGPAGGSLDDVKKMDTIIATTDLVAADAYATTLFDIKPERIPYIPAAAKAGLGSMDLKSLRIEELAVEG